MDILIRTASLAAVICSTVYVPYWFRIIRNCKKVLQEEWGPKAHRDQLVQQWRARAMLSLKAGLGSSAAFLLVTNLQLHQLENPKNWVMLSLAGAGLIGFVVSSARKLQVQRFHT